MTTTLDVVSKNSRLKAYESLEIKRRFSDVYEAEWVDVTEYLVQKSSFRVSQLLDWAQYGYGEFKTGTAAFRVDNRMGAWAPTGSVYSLFEFATSRHYTRIRYKAGYRDSAGVKIDEVLFEGLLNEKTARQDFNNGELSFNALSRSSVLSESTVLFGQLSASLTISVVIALIMSRTSILQHVGYDASKISPGIDILFDNAAYYENKSVSEAFNEMAQKSNSVWYVDSSNDLVFTARAVTAVSPFSFIGGTRQRRDTNIINIESYDEGVDRIINQISYDTGSVKYQITPSTVSLQTYGTQKLSISGEDITTQSTINSIATNIISEWKNPRPRIVLSTIYMPNIIGVLDRCTVDYSASLKTYNARPTMYFNQGSFNNGEFFGIPSDRMNILPNRYWTYYGYTHDPERGLTFHHMVQGDYV